MVRCLIAVSPVNQNVEIDPALGSRQAPLLYGFASPKDHSEHPR
jgi:hypothetical protein